MIYPKGCCRLDLNNLFFLVFLRVLRGQLLFPGLKYYAGFSPRAPRLRVSNCRFKHQPPSLAALIHLKGLMQYPHG